MSRMKRGIALLGVCATLMGIGGISAVRADSMYDKLNGAVRHDMDTVRRDQNQIQDLLTKRHRQKTKGDYRHAGYTSNDIAKARINLRRDEALLAHDRSELASYKRSHRL